MANPEHVSILESGVASWNKWREDNPHIEPDLSGVKLAELLSKNDKHLVHFDDLFGYSPAKITNRWKDWSSVNGVEVTPDQDNIIQKEVRLTYRAMREPISMMREVGVELERAQYCLIGINLSRTNLSKAVLDAVVLAFSDLSECNLEEASFYASALHDVDLSSSRMSRVLARHCNFNRAMMNAATAKEASFQICLFDEAILKDADIRDSGIFNAKLTRADLSGADFRGVKAFILDETVIAGTRFPKKAVDPWTKLRRRYSGPASSFNYILTGLYFIPLLANAFYLWALTNAQERTLHAINQSDLMTIQDRCGQSESSLAVQYQGELIAKFECDTQSVFSILFGIGTAGWFWAAFGLALLSYQITRLFFTRTISLMRDREERSGVSPEHFEYALMSFTTEKVLIYFERISFLIVAMRMYLFLFETEVVLLN